MVKPMSVFLTLPALIGLAWARQPSAALVVNVDSRCSCCSGSCPRRLYYG